MVRPNRGTLLLGGFVALLVGCSSDLTPPSTATTSTLEGPAPLSVQELQCTASLSAGTMRCGTGVQTPGIGNAIIFGGQSQFVQLTSSNVAYNSGTGDFSFDVTVQSLIPQKLGTTDGTTGHADGVRVFFRDGPTTTGGTGVVTVANADGTGTFTASSQAYFQYSGSALGADGMLSANEVSTAKTWILNAPATVTTFDFKVLISTEVQFPDGYIDITPGSDTLAAGSTHGLTAVSRNARGVDETVDHPVTWATGDAATATIDLNTGLVTAVAAGETSITATGTSPARTGTMPLAVCPNMAVGDVFVSSDRAAMSSFCLAGGSSGNAEYTYIPMNASTASTVSLTVTGNNIVAVTGPPSPKTVDRFLPADLQIKLPDMEQLEASDRAHVQFLEADRRLATSQRKLIPADGRGHGLAGRRATRMVGDGATISARGDKVRLRWFANSTVAQDASAQDPSMLIVTGVPTVGDLWNLNVAQGCSGALDTRVGMVRSVSSHVIIVSDTANPPGGFTTAQYDSIALEFDTLAYEVDTAAFGGPTDLDVNGRMVAFYTRAVNELSPPASSVVVLGYFTSRDLFSSAPASCPRSNEGEMFYMLVPDPTGVVNSNVRTVSFVRGSTVGTLAHEAQHAINASRRVYENGTWSGSFEEVWLNEGLSHIAEELVFYRASVGLTPRNNIIVTQLTTGPNASRRVAAFNAYANPNFGRARPWLQRPDTTGPFRNTDLLSVRGSTWMFLRYAADRLGGTESNTWSGLVNTQNTGLTNLQTVLGEGDLTPWFRDFIAATYADDAVSGVASQYTHQSWSYRSLYTALNGSYQLVPRALSNGVGLTLTYKNGGGSIFARFGVVNGTFANVTTLSGGVVPVTPMQFAIIRSK